MADPSLREQFVAILIDQVASDHYPSSTTMDQIERCMTDRLRVKYVQVLMDKLTNDHYPSPDITRRVASLVR